MVSCVTISMGATTYVSYVTCNQSPTTQPFFLSKCVYLFYNKYTYINI